MLSATKSAAEKREAFKAALKPGKLLRFPGAFSPLVALAADLGLPDTGLTTRSEVAARGAKVCDLNVVLPPEQLACSTRGPRGMFLSAT